MRTIAKAWLTWAVLGSPSPSCIFLYCVTTWKAFRAIMLVGCLLSYSLLVSHPPRKGLDFYICRHWTCWLFAFSVSSFSLFFFFFSFFRVLPSLTGFLCQKQMSDGHRPPASIALFMLSCHQLLPLSWPVAVSCTDIIITTMAIFNNAACFCLSCK